jgi:hypothetical protein
LADVEKKVLEEKGLSTERKETNNGICGGKVTNWKRKIREEKELNGNIDTPLQGARKKRDLIGGLDAQSETPEKNFVTNQFIVENGLGLAEVVPADRNEDHRLELPRAWDPLDSSSTLPYGEGEAPNDGFLNGDQTTENKNGVTR